MGSVILGLYCLYTLYFEIWGHDFEDIWRSRYTSRVPKVAKKMPLELPAFNQRKRAAELRSQKYLGCLRIVTIGALSDSWRHFYGGGGGDDNDQEEEEEEEEEE